MIIGPNTAELQTPASTNWLRSAFFFMPSNDGVRTRHAPKHQLCAVLASTSLLVFSNVLKVSLNMLYAMAMLDICCFSTRQIILRFIADTNGVCSHHHTQHTTTESQRDREVNEDNPLAQQYKKLSDKLRPLLVCTLSQSGAHGYGSPTHFSFNGYWTLCTSDKLSNVLSERKWWAFRHGSWKNSTLPFILSFRGEAR